MLRSTAVGGLALGLTAATTVLTSAAALAADVNGVHGNAGQLGVVAAIFIFGVAPVGLLILISLIFLRPGSAPGTQRYRPNRGWDAEPTWLGVPAREAHHVHALQGADELEHGSAVRAEQAAQTERVGAETPVARHDPSIGGARGHW